MPETKKLVKLIIYLEAFGSIWKLTVFAILHHFHTEITNQRKQ